MRRDAEEAEIDHHIKQAFRQAHRDMVNTGQNRYRQYGIFRTVWYSYSNSN